MSEWAPRIGLAYAPAPRWALRASYGITDIPWSVDPYTSAYGVGLNPSASLGYDITKVVFQLKNGPPANSVVYPSLSNLSNSQFNYQNVNYYPEHRPASSYQEALVSIQHEFPGQLLLDTSYVFTKGTHLGFTRDINQVPQSQLSGYAQGKYSSCYNDPSAYPLFCSIGAVLFDSYSNYNALQVRAEKRLSYGLSFIFNYAYAKTMDAGTGSGNNASADVWQNAFNVGANYGLSTLDVRNTINGSASYELPFGKGKMFALHGITDEVLGGWRATGVYQVHSGIPFTVRATNNGADLSGSEASNCSCGYSWLPNVTGNPVLSHKGFNPNVDQFFNYAAFTVPANGTFGNEGRNSLIGPNWRDLDMSVGKSFNIYERLRLELRADVTNLFNHPNFAQPADTVGPGVTVPVHPGDAAIVPPQQIQSAATARFMQLGGRFTF